MAGFKAAIGRSMERRLLVGISAVLLVFSLASGLWSFAFAFQEANELQDDQLRQIAHIAGRGGSPGGAEAAPDPSTDADIEARVAVWSLPARRNGETTGRDTSELPQDLRDGLQTVSIGGPAWRLFVRPTHDGRRVVVGQQTAGRNAIAIDSALLTAVPMLLLWPVLCALIGILVRHALEPVNRLARTMDRTTDHHLRPVPAGDVPAEIQPFVQAINRLLVRLSHASEVQRRFVADAAHELRSPLMALSLQIENAGGAKRTESMLERLAPARQGLTRLRDLLEQLLALTRVQSQPSRQSLPVPPVLRAVVEELLPQAERKGIELHMACPAGAVVAAQEIELTLLLRNVLDNAIRYAAPAGRVDIRIQSEGRRTTIDVRDDGPGIPEEERAKVFDAFYRIGGSDEAGSGLGLAIVRTVVDRLGGAVDLAWADESARKGLRVKLSLRASSAPPAPA